MTQPEILQSIQNHFATYPLQGNDLKEATIFYNDIISEMPYHRDINSFLLGVNTNNSAIALASNLTIITFEFDMVHDLEAKAEIKAYLDKKLNGFHEFNEYTWLGDILIIAFDF